MRPSSPLISMASRNPQAVEIRTLNEEHTCNGVRHAHHRQAGAAMIASAIEGRVHDLPSYRPRDVRRDVRQEQGINVSYSTA
jgi:hypothetical protein